MATIIKGPWKRISAEGEKTVSVGDLENLTDVFIFEPEPVPAPKPSFIGNPIIDRLFAAASDDKK
jgi:hypothetical protein